MDRLFFQQRGQVVHQPIGQPLALCEKLLCRGGLNAHDTFWVLATKVEAKVGLVHRSSGDSSGGIE